MDSFNWKAALSRFLKAEMAQQGVSRVAMAERLMMLGVAETESSLNNKLSRGTFSAVFFMQCMVALGRDAPALGSVVPESLRRSRRLDGAVPVPSRSRRPAEKRITSPAAESVPVEETADSLGN